MNANLDRATARLSKSRKYLIVRQGEKTMVLNANLVRYLFDVPYTRKDGTHIDHQEIYQLKQRAQAAYDKKVRKSAG